MLNYLNYYFRTKEVGMTCLYKNNLEFCFSWVSLARIIVIIRNRAGKKFKELLSPSFFPKQAQPYTHTSRQMSPHVFKGPQRWICVMIHRKSIPFLFLNACFLKGFCHTLVTKSQFHTEVVLLLLEN